MGCFCPSCGGVISLPGQPVCWRNVEGANISNSAGHDKDKLHATILFLRWMRNMFSDYVDDPELIGALQCYIHTILRISLHKHYNICGLWGYLWLWEDLIKGRPLLRFQEF